MVVQDSQDVGSIQISGGVSGIGFGAANGFGVWLERRGPYQARLCNLS